MTESATKTTEYQLIIRTNSYAGNFEREICTFVTGRFGECEVGKELVDPAIYMEFEPYVIDKPDDHGCRRPVALGKDTNDLVIFLEEALPQQLFELAYNRAVEFCAQDDLYEYKPKGVKILSVEMVQLIHTISEREIWRKESNGQDIS